MGGLVSALGAAQRSLSTFSRGLSVIQENIANAATPGYARQRVELAPIIIPGSGQPSGVEVQQVRSLRDGLLDLQAYSAHQRQSQLETTVELYSRVEPLFRLDGQGSVGDAADALFGAAAQLSTNAADLNLRQAFLDAADGFSSNVRETADELGRRSNQLDSDARATVRRINSTLSEIAELQSQGSPAGSAEPNVGVETRTAQALGELSELTGFTIQTQRNGTFSILIGAASVLTGDRVRPLQVSRDPQLGLRILDSNGRDATASIEGQGGRLGAVLEAHNQTLPALRGELNRLTKTVADRVNEQLARGVDLSGQPGRPLFEYATSFFEGSGRAPGTAGAATPAPPVSVDVAFSGGVTGSISATLDSFAVGAAAPAGAAAGDTLTLTFTSADGAVQRTLTTAPLLGGETAADLAVRINDQIALAPDLAGLIQASDAGGALKLTLSDSAGQGFSFSAQTSSPAFTSGLEAGGALGGHSADEIAAALNAQVALDQNLVDAGIRFSAVNGEVRVDGDVRFGFSVVDTDPAATGFTSGLDGVSDFAGGADAAASIQVASYGPAGVAAGTPGTPDGNRNAQELAALASAPLIDGLTVSDFYAGLVVDLGGDAQSAQSQLQTQRSITAAAEALRDNLSGVDINEEAVQLMQYERGYSAMLRMIQVIDELSSEVLSIVR